jgi:hypothetical protein
VPSKIPAGSAESIGVSLVGVTRINDVGLVQGKAANDHLKQRVKNGKKDAWDHSKAKKVKRNDLGQRVPN